MANNTKQVKINPQERIINLLIDLLLSSRPIEISRYQDAELWGDERTFRRMKSLINQVWERRNQTPLFEIVDAQGRPKQRGEGRFLKLVDKGLTTQRSERMAVMPAFMQMLQTLKGTILADEFKPLYSSWYADLSRKERQHFDRTEKKFFCLNKGTKKYDDPGKSEIVEEVYDALLKEQILSITFVRSKESVTQRALPLSLVMFNSGLYLLCRFEKQDHQKIYSFAIDSLKSASSLKGTSFTYPVDFDPKEYFDGDFGLMRGSEKEKHKVELLYAVDSWVGPYLKSRQWTGNETYSRKNGDEKFSMEVSDLREVESWILPLLTEAKLIGPSQLKENLKSKVEGIVKRNF